MPSDRTLGLRLFIKTQTQSLQAQLQALRAEAAIADFSAAEDRVEKFFDAYGILERTGAEMYVPKMLAAERKKVGDATVADVRAWGEKHLGALDRHTASLQLEQLQVEGKFPRPTDAEIEAMSRRIASFTVKETQMLYATANDREQIAIEAVSNVTGGRVPTKSSRGTALGGVEWVPLLDPKLKAEAVKRRLAVAAPVLAAQIADLEVLREVYAVIAAMAERAVVEEMARFGIRPETEVVFKDPKTGVPIPAPADAGAAS